MIASFRQCSFLVLFAFALAPATIVAQGVIGADLPWTTYEAESMRTTGTVLGPNYAPYRVEMESSGERCVRLGGGEYVEFTAKANATALVVRYSLPDAEKGGGLDARLTLQVNGREVRAVVITSRYSHLYGDYPFTNDPRAGKQRNFYDEARLSGVRIAKGDVVRLQKTKDFSPYCVIDLIDLEAVAPPLTAPANALSVRDFGADGQAGADDTAALRACIAAAAKTGRVVWVPGGTYQISGDIIVPTSVTIQGAGMWYTTFVGDAALYGQADRRVRFKLVGRNIRLADFAIVGRLNYRNDREPNDGIVGDGCSDSIVARIWVEHTKVGMWLYNCERLRIVGCRFRDTIADGINLSVGTADTVVENCSARGTGDDCFAIWPVPADQGFVEAHRPGNNVIRRCTGQLPFLGNGAAIYGGAGNCIEDCRFTDITSGCGILLSTTFPTSDRARKIDNNFSGATLVRHCEIVRCGGYDHDWGWRAAVQLCLDRRNITGVTIQDVTIRDSLSDAISVLGPGSRHDDGVLSETKFKNVRVERVGLGTKGCGLWIRKDARGQLTLIDSDVTDVVNESKAFVIVR